MSVELAMHGRDELQEAFADDAAFQRWYERVMPRVYSYLSSRVRDDQLAEELTQQAFIAAIETRAKFDGRSDSVTWLCSIARHKLADHFRRLEREERRDSKVVVHEIEMETDTDRWAGIDEREAIMRALEALPSSQRAALIFVDMDELSVREAAALLGKSHGATQSLVARARSAFRAAYEREARDD